MANIIRLGGGGGGGNGGKYGSIQVGNGGSGIVCFRSTIY